MNLQVNDLIHPHDDKGNALPSFVNLIGQRDSFRFVAETFLNEEFPTVLFCIYHEDDGIFAGNVLTEASKKK